MDPVCPVHPVTPVGPVHPVEPVLPPGPVKNALLVVDQVNESFLFVRGENKVNVVVVESDDFEFIMK